MSPAPSARRRHAGILAVALGGALAAVVLAGCGVPSTSSSIATASQHAPRPTTQAIDIGRVRVVAPTTWGVIVEPTPCARASAMAGATCFEPPCAPGSVGVHVSKVLPSLHCKEALKGNYNSVWISYWTGPWLTDVTQPVQPLPGWHGDAVVVTAPALDAVLYGFGAEGVAVAESYGPSSLAALSDATLPVRTPTDWRDVRFANLVASVPSTWSVHDLSDNEVPNPGACTGAAFSPIGTPAAYVGFSSDDAGCPFLNEDLSRTLQSRPADGLWLAITRSSSGSTEPPLGGLAQSATASTRGVTHDQHGLTMRLLEPVGSQPAGSVWFVVSYGGRETLGLLGLGVAATTAERVLSSIRPS